MATPASSEASEIRRRGRQRLIGAIALVLVLVVFVPMVLDSEPRREREAPALAIPSRQNAPALPDPAPAPKGVASAPVPAPAAVEPVKAAETPAKSAPAPKAPAPVIPAPDNDARGQAPAGTQPTAKAPSALEGFAVQVGAFRDAEKLRLARDKLAAAGVAHYTERLESAAGPLTRLRAGPFPTREAAEGAAAKLKRAALEGKVVALP